MTVKQGMRTLKRRSLKKLDSAKKGVKSTLNINRYNRYLFIFETLLLVGVLGELFEKLILGFDYGIYLNVLLIMVSTGIIFALALTVIEKIAKGSIIWLVRLSQNKILRVIVHAAILFGLYCLYAQVYFDTSINLTLNIGLSAV